MLNRRSLDATRLLDDNTGSWEGDSANGCFGGAILYIPANNDVTNKDAASAREVNEHLVRA